MKTYHTVVRLSSGSVFFSKKINVFLPDCAEKGAEICDFAKKQRRQAEKKI